MVRQIDPHIIMVIRLYATVICLIFILKKFRKAFSLHSCGLYTMGLVKTKKLTFLIDNNVLIITKLDHTSLCCNRCRM